jgi:ribose transport system permease protein
MSGLKNYLGLIGALLAMCVLFSFLSENFLTSATFTTLSNDIPTLVVMAVGMTFVLIIGGIDLSVGSVMALAASVLSMAMVRWGWPLFAAAVLGVFVASL